MAVNRPELPLSKMLESREALDRYKGEDEGADQSPGVAGQEVRHCQSAFAAPKSTRSARRTA